VQLVGFANVPFVVQVVEGNEVVGGAVVIVVGEAVVEEVVGTVVVAIVVGSVVVVALQNPISHSWEVGL